MHDLIGGWGGGVIFVAQCAGASLANRGMLDCRSTCWATHPAPGVRFIQKFISPSCPQPSKLLVQNNGSKPIHLFRLLCNVCTFCVLIFQDFVKHEGRQWLDGFLLDPHQTPPTDLQTPPTGPPSDLDTSTTEDGSTGQKFIDTFRLFYPDLTNAYTCWSTVTGARATNYGTRIDYIFADETLARNGFVNCIIQPDVQGSDHCPVKGTLKWDVIPASKCPPLCTKFLPEFAGRQQKLSAFFGKTTLAKSQSDSGTFSESMSSSQESNEEKPPFKRSAPELNQRSKKKKTNKGTVAKQGSLLSFFSKTKTEQPPKSDIAKTDSNTNSSGDKTDQSDKADRKNAEVTDSSKSESTNLKSQTAVKSSQSDSWKSLFKGPPPAPLCKGHQEPCLLRTVKKDSLNKGRQFYVCNRPEGHKSNPEARCEHFEWVEKKKKK